MIRYLQSVLAWLVATCTLAATATADDVLPVVPVEGQPLAANVRRVVQAMQLLGAPLPADVERPLESAVQDRDHARLQATLDPHALLVVAINPESRVKVMRGPAAARLQQGGYTPVLIKIINESTITKRLQIASPQSGAVYAGA